MRISDWSSDVCSSDLELDAEHAALPLHRAQEYLMTQDVGQAPDDGQTESGAAASLARRIVELMELLEDPPALLLRDADPGIPDLDAQLAVAAPAPEQDAPFRRRSEEHTSELQSLMR